MIHPQDSLQEAKDAEVVDEVMAVVAVVVKVEADAVTVDVGEILVPIDGLDSHATTAAN